MSLTIVLAGWLSLATAPVVETKLEQLHPPPGAALPYQRAPGQTRAVVLIHGLHAHLFSNSNVYKAQLQSWQREDSELARALAHDSDVYAFAYAQHCCVEEVAWTPGLMRSIEQLTHLGYGEIVLLGHSAGGLVARHFIEDHPQAGITKVIQLGTPNGGSSIAKSSFTVRRDQEAFLRSLTRTTRREIQESRREKVIPDDVQFVCVVTGSPTLGDGVIGFRDQWTAALQHQGVPVVSVSKNHFAVVRSRDVAALLAEFVREDQPRWDPARVARARREILRQASAIEPGSPN